MMNDSCAMRMFAIALFLCGLIPSLAVAGPWPRDKGELFVAVTGAYRYGALSHAFESEAGLYLEYGVGRQLTLGLDAMKDSKGYAHSFAFLRIPISPGHARLKLAAAIGLGRAQTQDQSGEMLRASFSAGRGIKLAHQGWWLITTTIDHQPHLGDPTFKLDGTLGMNIGPNWKTFFDLETGYRSRLETAVTLRGSMAWQMRPDQHIVFGVEAKSTQQNSYGLRAGFWRRF